MKFWIEATEEEVIGRFVTHLINDGYETLLYYDLGNHPNNDREGFWHGDFIQLYYPHVMNIEIGKEYEVDNEQMVKTIENLISNGWLEEAPW